MDLQTFSQVLTAFDADHRHQFVVRAAWQAPAQPRVPAGFCAVVAERLATGEERWFLIPTVEYGNPYPFQFVIDQARHLPLVPPIVSPPWCRRCAGRGWLLRGDYDDGTVQVEACEDCEEYMTDEDAERAVLDAAEELDLVAR